MTITITDVDTANKLNLEKNSKKYINSFHNDVLNKISTIQKGLNAPSQNDYIANSFKSANYIISTTTRNKFIKGLNFRLKKSKFSDILGNEDLESIQETTNNLIDSFIHLSNSSSSVAVANTVSKKAVDIALKSETNKDFQKSFKDFLDNRTEMLLSTNVQNIAEQTKQYYAQSAHDKVKEIDPSNQGVTKTWIAVLDDRTRYNHMLANGQTVGINGIYIVGGQNMLRPSDLSLGATLDNVINCRCSSEFNF